jgi:putative oxidoreductase
MFQRLIATAPTWITVPLRLTLGVIFIGHGAQKVFGAFGGPGWAKITAFPTPFAFMRPSWLWMGAAAVSELLGGVCVMLTAMIGVHLKGGFFLPTGAEYTVALAGVCLALLIAGGGYASVDRALQDPRARRR